ncbi:Protein of unknown function [Gryllus bimaculatus]|nr:Protein of unknown function [Gryllus bimaculatus]
MSRLAAQGLDNPGFTVGDEAPAAAAEAFGRPFALDDSQYDEIDLTDKDSVIRFVAGLSLLNNKECSAARSSGKPGGRLFDTSSRDPPIRERSGGGCAPKRSDSKRRRR